VVLGEGLKKELEEYWANTELRDLEFKHEIARFSHFLRQRMAAGSITDQFIGEVLDLELALNELRFAPRRRILGTLRDASSGKEPDGLRPHPLVRVVRFKHDAGKLLEALALGVVPYGLPECESFLVLSAIGEELCVKSIEPAGARLLWRMQTGDVRCRDCDVQSLISEGLVGMWPAGPGETAS